MAYNIERFWPCGNSWKPPMYCPSVLLADCAGILIGRLAYRAGFLGNDAAIICSGITIAESLKAADILAERGVQARAVNLFAWEPLDTELIGRCAYETGAIVTAENHWVANRLGKGVADVACVSHPVPMGFIGAQERFGEVGDMPYLPKRFGLRAEDIAETALHTVARKQLGDILQKSGHAEDADKSANARERPAAPGMQIKRSGKRGCSFFLPVYFQADKHRGFEGCPSGAEVLALQKHRWKY